MRALVVSLGSIGRRHLANLRSLEPEAEITVWRQHAPRTAGGNLPPGVNRVVWELEEALASCPEVAIIASPATLHIETGLALARSGVHLLIEKPLSHNLEQVDELLGLCRERSLVLMVGYHLRFCKSLQMVKESLQSGAIGRLMAIRAEVGQFLPQWRPQTDYRQGVSARKELGGGAVLELSHELDYVRWLAGEVRSVQAEVGRLSDLAIDVEDVAEIILRFAEGGIGSVHLDMVQQPMKRFCQLIGTGGTLTWDGLIDSVRLFTASTGKWSDLSPGSTSDRNEMFVSELRHFLECVRQGKAPCVSGVDGRRVLEIALAVKESAETRQSIAL
ncbi:MAG: Gfo/Idh/MocA family oxidoreductase [Verrucomicrobia bacterium]|nr:Gfo/Idh/MocA family oxidoreductase [Verrucomicrobiota bacterium]